MMKRNPTRSMSLLAIAGACLFGLWAPWEPAALSSASACGAGLFYEMVGWYTSLGGDKFHDPDYFVWVDFSDGGNAILVLPGPLDEGCHEVTCDVFVYDEAGNPVDQHVATFEIGLEPGEPRVTVSLVRVERA